MTRRDSATDAPAVAAVAALTLAAALVARACGFTHVSDDDYCRVALAEAFAAAPRLDPSGTSWLPLPFWVNGAAMVAFGRSLAVARAVAVVLAQVGAVALYGALRRSGMARWAAVAAVGCGFLVPWNTWLSAATVPEALTACLIASAALSVTDDGARPLAAAAALVASLSRYEAWPVALVVVAASAAAAVRHGQAPAERRRQAFAAILAAAGPLAWMAWNRHAHGSALHFVDRVARYRLAIGASPASLEERLLGYPRGLASTAGPLLVTGVAGAAALAITGPAPRRRVAGAAGCVVVLVAFLIVGDVRDGAPTHHPERAILSVTWVLAAWTLEGATLALQRLSPRTAAAATAATLALLAALVIPRWPPAPGRGPAEDREAQLARGFALRHEGAAHVTVTPCAYEHFALIAAFGAPERVTPLPPSHEPVTAACPRVEVTPEGPAADR